MTFQIFVLWSLVDTDTFLTWGFIVTNITFKQISFHCVFNLFRWWVMMIFFLQVTFVTKIVQLGLGFKLNTKMGLNHPTTRNFWKGSRHSRRLRFGMLASLKLRNRTHTHSPHPPTKSEHLTLSLGEGGNFKSKVIPSWTLSTWVLCCLAWA